jgi:hypothetical protein
MPELAGWDNFYIIIGSSAAALTGLMFVVIALSGETGLATGDAILTIRAFSTPTLVHFGAVLLLAALLTTPGHTLLTLSASLGACGIIGLGFTRWVVLQMRRQTAYKPVGDDWLWHVGMPLLAYACLLLGAAGLWWRAALALVVVAGAELFLLYIGIHNAWDAAIYVSVARRNQAAKDRNA